MAKRGNERAHESKRKESQEPPYRFFLNGEPVDVIPQEALDKMAERLSRVVSQHFREHPDEYERFLKSRERKGDKTFT